MDLIERKDIDRRVVTVLDAAVRASGLSRREIARSSGLHKDALLRVLAGKRPVTTQEALDIFAAAGFEPRPALILALLGQEALGFEWATTNMAPFLDALIAALPNALSEALGEDIAEIRPRWGAGTARMIAKSLAEHVAELSRRETAFGLN